MHEIKVEVNCPRCGVKLVVAVAPGADGGPEPDDPGEPPEILSITVAKGELTCGGCPHGPDLLEDAEFAEAVFQAANIAAA